MFFEAKVDIFKNFKLPRGLCKKNRTHVLFHSIIINESYAITCMCTLRRHFENSKMVNWVKIVQKLTKIQGIM